MDKIKMIKIAERNLRKAKLSQQNNSNRKGITSQELESLADNVEYAQSVYDLISKEKF